MVRVKIKGTTYGLYNIYPVIMVAHKCNDFDSKLRPSNSIRFDFRLPNSIRFDFRLPNLIRGVDPRDRFASPVIQTSKVDLHL